MSTGNPAMFVIALYVPDALTRALSEDRTVERCIMSGVPELDFIPPPWWEISHTVRLGLIQEHEGGTQAEAGR